MDYRYNAIVNSIHDGDTLNVDIDLGFGIWLRNQNIRLYGINAPELKGLTKEAALKSRSRLSELVIGKKIIIETIKDKKEKYGRWLGKIFVDNIFINNILISEGLAIPYME
jgi:micrococcal nuclease